MLLSLTTTRPPATDLGYLLHKHPDRFQTFDLPLGRARVFYPEASAERCTACLLLEIDPVALARGKGGTKFALEPYVNDRPYASTSLLSTAIAQVYGSALSGQCKPRPELVSERLPLTATLEAFPLRGDPSLATRLFGPLGYAVTAVPLTLDERFPEWGPSPYVRLTLEATATVQEVLTHLFVLIPACDGRKHYFVGGDEVDKLLAKGGDWLPAHPEREWIARRYLKHQRSLTADALERLAALDAAATDDVPGEDEEDDAPTTEAALERTLSLHEERIRTVAELIRDSGATTVLDLGCGEGRLLRELLPERRITRLVGMDVAVRSLERARETLPLDRLPAERAKALELLHGSLVYRDRRLEGFDAAALVEVIEHLDPDRLEALERNVWAFARPRRVFVTTPNREYNAVWPTLPAGRFRHPDHRFEWDRAEFRAWAEGVAARNGYGVECRPLGPLHAEFGAPTQLAAFVRA